MLPACEMDTESLRWIGQIRAASQRSFSGEEEWVYVGVLLKKSPIKNKQRKNTSLHNWQTKGSNSDRQTSQGQQGTQQQRAELPSATVRHESKNEVHKLRQRYISSLYTSEGLSIQNLPSLDVTRHLLDYGGPEKEGCYCPAWIWTRDLFCRECRTFTT